MKHKKALAIALSFCMLGSLLPANTVQTEAAAVKLKKITLNQSFRVIKKGGKVKLKASFNPKKAKTTVTWKSSNKKVATVSKSGVVKGKKKGKATITAKAKGKKATCKIQVGVPVKKITVAKKNITLKVGQSVSAGASVQPANASVKKMTYSSNNNKVATVTSAGMIRGVSAGTAQIQVTSADGNNVKETIVVKVTGTTAQNPSGPVAPEASDSSRPGTPDPSEGAPNPSSPTDSGDTATPSPSNDPSPTDPPTGGPTEAPTPTPEPAQKVYVTDESDFEEAFYNDNLRELYFTTTREVEAFVPDGDYSYVTVILDTPNADITFEGKIGELHIDNDSSANYYPTIRTSKKLTVKNKNNSPFRFIIMNGGELSSVQSETSDDCPDIYGLGRIKQTITETKQEKMVTALLTEEDLNASNVFVSGGVCSAKDKKTIPGAKVILTPYSGKYHVGELTATQIKTIESDAASISMTVSDRGIYTSASPVPQGNYIAVVSAEGYETAASLMSISSQYGDSSYVAGVIHLIPETVADSAGTIKGSVKRNTNLSSEQKGTYKPLAAGAVVTLRKGNDNVDGNIVDSVVTEADGSYEFSDVPYGYYTLTVSSEDMTGNYSISWDNTTLMSKEQTFNLYANMRLGANQIRFVASWSEELKNVNLHMTAPGVSGTEYHVWEEDDEIWEGSYLIMKSDTKTSEESRMETSSWYTPSVDGDYVVTATVCAVDEEYSEDDADINTDALAWSGMQVKAYQGDVLVAVYHVPLEEGNVWNVVTYDISEAYYECDGELETADGGVDYFESYDKSYRGKIKSMIADGVTYRGLLEETYDPLESKIAKLEKVVKEGDDEATVFAKAYDEEIAWFEKTLQDSFVVDVDGDNVSDMDYQWNSNDITVYTMKQGVTVEELETSFENASNVSETDKDSYIEYRVTLKDGQKRVFKMYLVTELDYITPIEATYQRNSFTNDPTDIVEDDSGDLIYVYGDVTSANLGKVIVDFGKIGNVYKSGTYQDETTKNYYVAIKDASSGDELRRWDLVYAAMPLIKAKTSGTDLTRCAIDYEGDTAMTVYWSDVPVNFKSAISITAPTTDYTLSYPADQPTFDVEVVDEIEMADGSYVYKYEMNFRVILTDKKVGTAKTISVSCVSVANSTEMGNLYLWDLEKNTYELADWDYYTDEKEQEYRNSIIITVDRPLSSYDWEKLYVEFEDEKIGYELKVPSNILTSSNATITVTPKLNGKAVSGANNYTITLKSAG